MAHKETDIHEDDTNLMGEHNPNPNDYTRPSRYRHKGHRIVEQPTLHYPSRYRHDNTNMVPHDVNLIAIIKTNSRRGRINQETNEKRNEGKTRTAASGAEKTATRQQKEAEATEDRPWRKKGQSTPRQVTKSPM